MNRLRPRGSVASRSFHRTLIALSLALPLCAQATTAWVASSTEKIRPSAMPSGATTATLSAARNEFEAFQVAVTGPATAVSVTASPLTGPGQLPAPRLFREALIQLANASGPDGQTGAFPDALVPDVDDVVGEQRNAFPFDVPAGEARAVWVELHVPPDAAPGTYHGAVVVHAAGQPDVPVPVTVTVWDFALPSTSSLKSHFGLYYGDLIAAHGVSGDALSALRARYAQLGLDHRISIGGVDDGNRSLDHFAQFYGALVDGTAPTQLGGARLTSVQFMGSRTRADYSAWATFFKAKGWFDRLFDYTCDEPPQTCQWSDIPARNATMKSADPAFRSLVTTTVQEAAQQGVLSSVDLLVPVVNWMDDKAGMTYAGAQRAAYDDFLASGPGKELWMYQSCMSHGCGGTSDYFAGWVSYAIDAAAIRSRGMEWLSFLWGATGELYWETTFAFDGDAWSDQWRFTGNGDGTLLYPGTAARIGGRTDIPVASLRLKMLREGMEDFEYLTALSDAGDPALARQLAASLFPNGWTQPSVSDLLAARDRIARRVVELRAASARPPASSADPAAPAGSSAPPVASSPAATDPGVQAAGATAAGAGADPGASVAAPAPGAGTDGSVVAAGTASGAAPAGGSPPAPVLAGATPVSPGSGCSSGTHRELVAALGIAASVLLRRRRREAR